MKSSYEEIAAGFRARHPDIDLRMIWVPGHQYQTKFKTLSAAGDAPDSFTPATSGWRTCSPSCAT